MKFFSAVAIMIALSACAEQDDLDVDTSETSEEQALVTRPACTAANEGAQITEPVSGGYRVFQCDSGAWSLIRVCKTGGVCIDH
jgi:hypothetical protein